MMFFEPTLPSLPVNVTGVAMSAKARPLRRLRRDSCYGTARLALRVAFALEVLLATIGTTYFATQRGGWLGVFAALGCASVLAASLAAAEVAMAVLDCADLQLLRRREHDGEA